MLYWTTRVFLKCSSVRNGFVFLILLGICCLGISFGDQREPQTDSSLEHTKTELNSEKEVPLPIKTKNATESFPKSPILLDANSGWTRDEKNLLTNFYSMYQPEVVHLEENECHDDYPWRMWFFGWACSQENDPAELPVELPDELSDDQSLADHSELTRSYPGYSGGDAIFIARAKQLDGPWEIYSQNYATGEFYWDTQMDPFFWFPVLTCQNIWYDSWHVGDPSVVYQNGTFYMAYSAMGCDEDGIPAHKSGDSDGNASCIMGAVSSDGIHWKRSEKPLLLWSNEKSFDEKSHFPNYFGGHQRPSLLFEEGKWKMWYDYRYNQIGYAECNGDFITGDWKEFYVGSKGMLKSVDFDVVSWNGRYYAYADPYLNWCGIKDETILVDKDDPGQWNQRQIVEYCSDDGIHWSVTGYFRPDNGYESIQIPQAVIDSENNRLNIFYATQRGRKFSSQYDWRWDNIRVMSRSLDSDE